MDDRTKIPPGLPRSNPTVSYWQDPPDGIADLRTTNDLPQQADYVIIGSGISGACIAYNLLCKKPNASVVILEARRACSGATGRNGGHTKSANYRTFLLNKQKLGTDEATRIAQLEYANNTETHAFARKYNIQCDSHPCKTVDAIHDHAALEAAVNASSYMNDHVDGVEKYEILSKEEIRGKYMAVDALGGLRYDAGSISGYKFTIGILKLALERGLNLQTDTPVTAVEPATTSTSGNYRWSVKTDRGTVSTRNCILASNGYSAHLYPKLQGVIVPLRGQMSAQRPGDGLPEEGCLPTTYSFIYENGYEYMIPRPKGSKFAGDICIGGGWAKLPDQGASEFGETDDTVLNAPISAYLTSSAATYFGGKNWGRDDPDGRVRREWTGVMGCSADGLPFVGELPGQSGLWIQAAFNGHGMSLCFKCAEALTGMLLGAEDEGDGRGVEEAAKVDEWFPRNFVVSEERFKVKFEGRRHDKPAPQQISEVLETRSQL